MTVSAKPPSGTRDFLPADVARREHVVSMIRRAYERHGFVPLETPTMERIEVLLGKYGDEGDQLIFRVLKRGEKLEVTAESTPDDLADLALRYDLTVPLARVVAAHSGSLPRYFRRYQIQPVWRADRPQKGRYREFYQCDVDFVGSTSIVAEHTVITAVTDALAALGFGGFTIRLNDRRVLTGIMDVAGVAEAERGGILTAIDKLDKIGIDGVRAEFVERGLNETQIAALEPVLAAISASEHPEASSTLLDQFGALLSPSAAGSAGIATMRELFALLSAAPVAAGRVAFDPSLARGLSYYTGPIFEIAVDGLSGSMGGGGRYDGLVGMFAGKSIPAVGFSLGLERLLVVMEERGMYPDVRRGSDVVVTRLDAASTEACLGIARGLREAGVRCEVFPDLDKLGKQFKYAEEIGARWVVLAGERELRDATAVVRDLLTGEQTTHPLSQLAEYVRSVVGGR
jgi:histidyl-tRNA synthetase